MKSYLHFLLLPLFLFVLFLAGAAKDPVQTATSPTEPAAEDAAVIGSVSTGKLPLPGKSSSLSTPLNTHPVSGD